MEVLWDGMFEVVRKFLNEKMHCGTITEDFLQPRNRDVIKDAFHKSFNKLSPKSFQEHTHHILTFILVIQFWCDSRNFKLKFFQLLSRASEHSDSSAAIFEWMILKWKAEDGEILQRTLKYFIRDVFIGHSPDGEKDAKTRHLVYYQNALERDEIFDERLLEATLHELHPGRIEISWNYPIEYLAFLCADHNRLLYDFLKKKNRH